MAADQTQFTGATAHDVAMRKYGGNTRPLSAVVPVGTVPTRLLQNNPRRVGAILVNQGSSDVDVDFQSTVVVKGGIRLAANGGVIEMDVNDDGEVVAWEFWAIAPAGVVNVYTLGIERV